MNDIMKWAGKICERPVALKQQGNHKAGLKREIKTAVSMEAETGPGSFDEDQGNDSFYREEEADIQEIIS